MMKTAVIQMNSSADKIDNVRRALAFTKEAIEERAALICLPEYFYFRGSLATREEIARVVEPIDGPTVKLFSAVARKNKVYILLGSVYEQARDGMRAYNTSILIGPEGCVKAAYRKNNLFHLRLPRAEICEKKLFYAGKKTAMVKAGPFILGMAVCFDVRFPLLFERYASRGANLFTVPAAFSYETGKAHWELLVRARAVETFSYVLAPNQTGLNAQGFPCWGQSLIVGPWGQILAQAGHDKEEVIYAVLDPKEPGRLRRMFPEYKKFE